MSDIATKKLFENEKIAVWEMVLEPGESTGVHTHSHDYVFFVIEGSTAEVTDKQGNPLATLEMRTGETMSLRLEGQELVTGDLRLPATHSARNIGSTRYREILVETK
jgi:mannose-6-phosphate isomerase-like protein (cupin superfamily)